MDKLTTFEDLVKTNNIINPQDLNLIAYCERLGIKTIYESVQNTEKSTTKTDDIAEPVIANTRGELENDESIVQ